MSQWSAQKKGPLEFGRDLIPQGPDFLRLERTGVRQDRFCVIQGFCDTDLEFGGLVATGGSAAQPGLAEEPVDPQSWVIKAINTARKQYLSGRPLVSRSRESLRCTVRYRFAAYLSSAFPGSLMCTSPAPSSSLTI